MLSSKGDWEPGTGAKGLVPLCLPAVLVSIAPTTLYLGSAWQLVRAGLLSFQFPTSASLRPTGGSSAAGRHLPLRGLSLNTDPSDVPDSIHPNLCSVSLNPALKVKNNHFVIFFVVWHVH